MARQRCYLLIVGIVAAQWAAPARAWGQSPFDPPPVASGPPTPGVRGIFDPSQAPTGPIQSTGAEGAPAATFVAPGGRLSGGDAAASAAVASNTTISAEAVPLEGGEIVARIDGQVVLASDVLWQVNQLIALNKVPPDQVEEARKFLVRRQVLDLIDTKILFADFRRTLPPENMQKVEEAIAEPFEKNEVPRLIKMFKVKDRGELDELLKESGTSVKDIQRQFTEKTVAGEWLRQRTPKPKEITHEAMLAYYNDHLKEYEYPARVEWEELMVRFDRCGGDREAAWRMLAEMGNEVWTKAQAAGAVRGPVFAEVAKAKSHGFTAADGGLHPLTTHGALKCEELNVALATLEIGQLSDGIESELGFHIVRVLRREAAGRTPFTEAQAKIRETLQREQKEVLFLAEIAEIRKAARVWTVFDGDVSGVRLTELLEQKQRR